MRGDPATWRRIAALLPTPLVVVDVGARGGLNPAWAVLGSHVVTYGFEPDPEECTRLSNLGDGVTYVPLALWSTPGEKTFHETEDRYCSSLLPPLAELAEQRPRLSGMRITRRGSVQVDTLDAWCEREKVPRIDHLQIDAQGAELDILKGSERTLEQVRAVTLEVQFNPLYEGVPLFGDLDRFLRDRGFALWGLDELSHCGFVGTSPVKRAAVVDYDDTRVELTGGGGQLLWANAHFVRAVITRPSLPIARDDCIRDALIAHSLGYGDLAEISLRRAASHGSSADFRLALDTI